MHAGSFRLPQPDWILPAFRERIREATYDFLHPEHRFLGTDARERALRSTMCFIPRHGRVLPDERLPFLYRPLVEFMLRLDWAHIVQPGQDRILMRRALRGIVPEAVLAGGAVGRHGAPILAGLAAAWPRITSLLTGRHLADLGVIEPRRFQAAVQAMRGGYPGPNIQFAYTALYLEAWMSSQMSRAA